MTEPIPQRSPPSVEPAKPDPATRGFLPAGGNYGNHRPHTPLEQRIPKKWLDSFFKSVADGVSIKLSVEQANADAGLVNGDAYSRVNVWDWLEESEAFADSFKRAKERHTHSVADDLIGKADEHAETMPEAAKHKLGVETRKWLLSKWNPGVYGDRLQLEANHNLKHQLELGPKAEAMLSSLVEQLQASRAPTIECDSADAVLLSEEPLSDGEDTGKP